ncbi:putative transcriptional regulator, GntR family [Deinococcus proteolyticus MRP]|uniref:Putative transcriptional regulator, GntR family n=1 Tax=Deinococcus proteolyticus (strain ATCC 35074 / DSM 20540 / JCM 6276 / NBRC 101906 / NCIMB 13154 / VKM Ac-1939 / CCM 2703 / MRP) TaxID=693977 RepID=F0RN19_DEIPM|nr:aminotransferase class I/II-fold pyridoxal phosphate-dependent enzyme [Deinococcus proteolyticus]ADY26161.1 putative transcriptional regulator, GntR family [Deinococcus proteolyticus MRP]
MTTPSNPQADALTSAQNAYKALREKKLHLNMQRGQPSDQDFGLSNRLIGALNENDFQMDGTDLRNYPGGIRGLPSARALAADYLDLKDENVIVWNNSSLELQGLVLMFALLHGLPGGRPWGSDRNKMIVTVPGYDRHFSLLEHLSFELVTVPMQKDGPDIDAVERLAQDPSVRGIVFVPTYSNPTGDSISPEKAARLAGVQAAAADFTIFADDAYRAHHLYAEDRDQPVNLVALCRDAGYPNRAFVYASTSKITFAGAGLGFVGSSEDNIAWLERHLNAQSIGPNKFEQARHVRFLGDYPGGLEGLMAEHARLIAPKFTAVNDILTRELGTTGEYATWTTPRGGYFISLDTAEPVAARVIELAQEAGISLTPAGSTFPKGQDNGRNIRLAPTRPPLDEVLEAMQGVAVCIRLATEEYRRK